MKKNRIIITGGSGFIGQFLVRGLKDAGWQKIIIIDRKQPQFCPYQFYQGNFSNQNFLRNIINKGDIIIHLACTTVPATSELNKEKDVKDNVIGALRLLSVGVEKGIKLFVFPSSGGTVYGDVGRRPAKETDCANPINSHGVMKLAIENYIKVFHKIYGLDFLIVRAGNPYGGNPDWRRKQGVIDIFLKKVIAGQPLEIWGDGRVVRDYIYINDFIDFFITALNQKAKNEIFNVASGQGHSLNDILRIIKQVTKREFSPKYRPKRNFDLAYNVLDISKARRLLGWRPRFCLKKGVEIMYKTLKRQINK